MLASNGHLAELLNGKSLLPHVQTLKMGPKGVSDGVPVLMVIGVSRVSDKLTVNNTHIPSVTTETFLIGVKDHLLRRWTAVSRFTDPHLIATVATATRATHGVFWTQSESFENVRANPVLPGAVFTFIPPPGSKQMKVNLNK